MLEKGQIVRNPKQSEWGLGKVLGMDGPRKVRIRFKGKTRLLDLSFVKLELIPKEEEIPLRYPAEWEDEWKRTGVLQQWRDEFPELFDGSRGKIMLTDGKRSNFANYALMYLLRRDDVADSLTYFELAHHAATSSTVDRRDLLHGKMREIMSDTDFDELREALIAAGFSGFEGEPDLFCWPAQNLKSEGSPKPKWFFAEAKLDDDLLESQYKWFKVCRETLHADIRVYRLYANTADTVGAASNN